MENKAWLKKFSVWEWFAMIAICVLIVAIILTAIIIADKKQELDELQKKNEEITQSEHLSDLNEVLNIYTKNINNQL